MTDFDGWTKARGGWKLGDWSYISDAIYYSLSLSAVIILKIIYDQHMLCIWFLE